jgi:hypothetical protein
LRSAASGQAGIDRVLGAKPQRKKSCGERI